MNTASFFSECFLIRDYYWKKKTIKLNIATLLLMKSDKETKVSRYFTKKKKRCLRCTVNVNMIHIQKWE